MTSKSNTPDDASGLIYTDREKQLLVYDALPVEFCRLIDSLPENPDAREVQQVIDRWGSANALVLIVQHWRGKYPGWEPPEAGK